MRMISLKTTFGMFVLDITLESDFVKVTSEQNHFPQ